jgi:tetratricopeptide (TPR) repeat protein
LLRAIIDRFADCLNEGGVLALGHSEMLPRDWTLAVEPIGEAFFYRSPRPASSQAVGLSGSQAVAQADGPTGEQANRKTFDHVVVQDLSALLDSAEWLANEGKMRQAAQVCREAIKLDGSLVRGHYLLGLLSLDNPPEAHRHFRRAVDLNPAHLPARLHLAESAEKMGRVGDAVHQYRTLERLARAKPPDEVLDPLEGITYGMLALIGQGALRRLE